MATLRVLRTAKATLTRTFYLDETATDATGTVAVAITRLDGTAVESGNATGPVSNVYSYTFGGRDVVDELVVTWTATVSGDAIVLDSDRLQVVGGFYFSLKEGRGVDSALQSTTTYPTVDLIERRIEVEDECERITGGYPGHTQAFVPRFRRLTLDGSGTSALATGVPWLRTLRGATVAPRFGQAAVALTSGELAAVAPGEDGVLRRTDGAAWTAGRRNVIVEVEHGRDGPSPGLVRASKIRFKSLLLQPRTALPDRAERIAVVDMGTVLLAAPAEKKTGIPEVDAEYARHPSPVLHLGFA